MINVEKITDTTFKITVRSTKTTTHEISVRPSYYNKLTGGNVAIETLVKKSFEFLLERESNTDILRSFDLPVIGNYFPEYELTMQESLKNP
jgi:hypothetical protein